MAANLARRGFKFDRERYLALEAERKELQMRVEGLRQTRNERSKAIGRAKAARRRRRGAEARGRHARRRARRGRSETDVADSRARRFSRQATEPAARVGSRRRGFRGERRGTTVGRSAAALVRAARSRRARREARAHRFRRRREAVGQPLRRAEGHGRASASRDRAVDARPAHARARLHRDVRAVSRQRCDVVRHGPAAEVRRGLVRARRREQAPAHSDGRGIADESRARHDRRSRRAADALDGAHAVLSLGGGIVRSGHARHDSPAPVRQGRARAHLEARRVLSPSSRCSSATPKPCSSGSAWRIA